MALKASDSGTAFKQNKDDIDLWVILAQREISLLQVLCLQLCDRPIDVLINRFDCHLRG